jgi:ubiquinone/menaquinone biosynthesis C-methylase UbiE
MVTKLNMRPLSEEVARNYDSGCYGPGHMQTYRNFRNETLARTIAGRFGDERSVKVLDVGCGTGLVLEYLSSLPARHELHGMDFSEPMLQKAREKAAGLENPPTLVYGSAYEIPYPDGAFDMVCSSRFIHQFTHEDKKRVLEEMYRVTRPGGVVAVEFYARPHYLFQWYAMPWRRKRDWKTHFAHYPTAAEVREVVGRPFEIVPVRLIGARVWRALAGDAGLRKLTEAARHAPLGLLKDEYFVVINQ